MSKFRLKVDLSMFFNDKRKYAYISLNPEWKHVKCLQDHVENLFKLPSIEFVAEDSCYFPPLEDISVIRKGDVLKAVECTTKNESNGIECVLEPEDVIHKKKKKSKSSKEKTRENDVQDEYVPPVKKSKKSDCDRMEETEPVAETSNYDVSAVTKTSVKKLKKLFDNKCKEAGFPSKKDTHSGSRSFTTEPEVIQCERSKRKRKRKKKTKKEFENSPIEYAWASLTAEQETPKTALEKTKSAEHIRFDEDGKAVACENDAKSSIKRPLTFRHYLDDLDASKARVITATVVSNDSSQPMNTVENSSVVPNTEGGNANNLESLPQSVGQNSEIHHVEEQRECNGYEKDTRQVGKKAFKCEDILKFAEPLESDPVEGDVLLFKIYRLNDNCEPSLSEYICGKFEGVEESTNFLKIFLIDGQDQLLDPEGKITVGLQKESSSYLFLKSEDLVDKKVFKM